MYDGKSKIYLEKNLILILNKIENNLWKFYYCIRIILKRPYEGYANKKTLRDLMLTTQPKLKRNDIPEGWTENAADCINRVL